MSVIPYEEMCRMTGQKPDEAEQLTMDYGVPPEFARALIKQLGDKSRTAERIALLQSLTDELSALEL
jgi:hypothetical protein